MNICGENRHLRQARERYAPFCQHQNITYNDKNKITIKSNQINYFNQPHPSWFFKFRQRSRHFKDFIHW
jgi:hypothetical protein